ncbi:hypothetical protein CC86DRAFT_401233 [Ophiobolus disseminans]|uniref:Uncharacterized protein n=1 Tax=Ophiobolus disseminans TaxID=1469910 RepID=A0A6A7AIH4_9PLEO|nr:hypothetical protein CC86DRAFT_401233 [Ophiobolus disseminans]
MARMAASRRAQKLKKSAVGQPSGPTAIPQRSSASIFAESMVRWKSFRPEQNKLTPPQQLINFILRQVKDEPFLWMVCRRVSRAFRREVEYMFQQTWLKETVLMPLDIASAAAPPWPVTFSDFENFVQYYEDEPGSQWWAQDLGAVTRIGLGINDTYISDAIIPCVEIHQATGEISINWKKLFTSCFKEEFLLSTLQAEQGIHTPSTAPWDLAYPIVHLKRIACDPESNVQNLPDYAMRVAVRQRRALVYGWFRPDDEQESEYKDAVKGAISRLQRCSDSIRVSELLHGRRLKSAEGSGWIYYVEDPELHGWKQWGWRRNRFADADWYNHAWEDSKDRGRTTWSEHAVVVEAERMARAWEKGLDWHM